MTSLRDPSDVKPFEGRRIGTHHGGHYYIDVGTPDCGLDHDHDGRCFPAVRGWREALELVQMGPSDLNDIAACLLSVRALPFDRLTFLARAVIQVMVATEAHRLRRKVPYVPHSSTPRELDAWLDRPIGDWPHIPINEERA